ncbi:MAG: ATP synthase F0 subunit C [Oscillospiraceae bacterium]|nr:ATP synthase F0 subunit C [Oscillospiraceae bacterium]
MSPEQLILAEHLATVMSWSALGAGIAVLSATITAAGQGYIGAKTVESIARQPEAKGALTTTMFISSGISETGGIYGLLIAFLLLYANPFVGRFIELFGLG